MRGALAVLLLVGCAAQKAATGDGAPSDDPYRNMELSDARHPAHDAVTLHRTTRVCGDDSVLKMEEVIPLVAPDGTRFRGATCRSRKAEMCAGEQVAGSTDTYLDEWCEDHAGKRIRF